jgi:hypothetical protein
MEASALGSFKINSSLIDTEASRAWNFSPSAELAFAAPVKSGWSASSQLRLTPARTNDPQSQLNLRVKEATLTLEWEEGTLSAGRILLRPESTALNEANRIFLRSEPSTDGVRWSFERDSLRYHFFAGGPWVVGAAAGFEWDKAKFSLLYRGERDKITPFSAINPEGDIVQTPRSAHTQEAELSIKVISHAFVVESLFQLMSQGVQRRVTLLDTTWGDSVLGSVDSDLPRSYNEYRVAVQGKLPLDRALDAEDFLVMSWAARTAPRLHSGTEDERFFRQGGGNDSLFSFAVESSNPIFSTQLGSGLEYSANPKYLFFAQRSDAGERRFVKAKAHVWLSTRIKF